ncbi:MAG: cell division protein SepF [Syntrophomonadaceae bacterium]|jgi:cell division inhibitor SepF|nr:cell division protein SepF [Syntrophomonadaceae bacterium]
MGVVDKIWSFLGVVEEEANEEDLNLNQFKEKEKVKSKDNVVSIHSNKTVKVVIAEPISFDEVQMLADHLKNRKQLIINFEKTPPATAQRLADFLSGTIYALEGQYQQLGNNIYIFAPNNTEFSRDMQVLMRKSNYSPSSPGGIR